MKNKSILSIIILGLILLSCEKDKEKITSEIKMGDYTNMIINYYDTLLIGGYNKPKYFNIDLNNNGINDIRFVSELFGSPNLGVSPRATIKSLSRNVQIYGYHKNDTLFLYRETTINDEVEPVEIHELYKTSCFQFSENDSIVQITPSYKLKPLEKGYILRVEDTYKTDTTRMADGYHAHGDWDYTNNDTIIIKHFIRYYDCHVFPQDDVKYIGVKLVNESLLGWIKVRIFDKYKISILESGIQK